MEFCKSILIADDNDDIRESIYDALSNEGYVVETACNGQEALEKLEKMDGPTLILLDLMMPVMNGWEFLDAQKKNAKFTSHQIVTMSAVNPTQSLEDSTPLDTAGSLQKPMSLGSLWDKVEEFCGPPPARLVGETPASQDAKSLW